MLRAGFMMMHEKLCVQVVKSKLFIESQTSNSFYVRHSGINATGKVAEVCFYCHCDKILNINVFNLKPKVLELSYFDNPRLNGKA